MMHALKNPSFFRPTSRPSSPAPPSPSRIDSGFNPERSRPLTKLSLSTFRKPSPAPPSISAPTPTPLVQDGSYLEMLSLKLSEAISRALAPPMGPVLVGEQVAGKRPIPPGRGHALGALIASELKAAADNSHLYRAILRCLLRPLSVLLSNLSSQLLPLISSSSFLTPPAPTLQAPNPNPTQLHALAIATFAGELLETFDEFGLGNDGSDVRDDGLKQIRDGLVSLVQRVINPLVLGIKKELLPLTEALETPNGVKSSSGGKSSVTLHSSVIALQLIMPVYARALSRYATSSTSQTILASLLISVIWRVMVALSHRPFTPNTPPSSPGLLPAAPKRLKGSPSSTPPVTPPASRFTIKLPSPASRPPSPPNPVTPSSAAVDARALYDLFNQLPRPNVDKVTTRLPSEAVEEAFHGLDALPALFDMAASLPAKIVGGHDSNVLVQQLESVTAELPTLIALPVLLQVNGSRTPSVSSYLGLSEEEYRARCLTGFGRADECAGIVGQRVLDQLQPYNESNFIVTKWLEGEIQAADN